MSCLSCLGKPSKGDNEDKELIIDVERAVADEAWGMFLVSHGRCRRRFLRRKDYKIEVPLNYYVFEQEGPQVFKTKKRPTGAVDAGADNHASKSRLKGRALAHHDQTSPEHTGLETVFNNDTDADQTYSFKFDKTRKASVNVSYQKGYSLGGKANFSLGLPKVLGDASLGLGMSMNLQVTKTTGETFEESISTAANSDIKVGAKTHCTVSVVMEERSLLAEFQLDMIMSMPAKRAPVYIKSASSGEVVFVTYINNLIDIFDDFPEASRVRDDDGNVREEAMRFHIEGVVDGMQLSSHRINLTSTKLPGHADLKEEEEEGEGDNGGSAPEPASGREAA